MKDNPAKAKKMNQTQSGREDFKAFAIFSNSSPLLLTTSTKEIRNVLNFTKVLLHALKKNPLN